MSISTAFFLAATLLVIVLGIAYLQVKAEELTDQ